MTTGRINQVAIVPAPRCARARVRITRTHTRTHTAQHSLPILWAGRSFACALLLARGRRPRRTFTTARCLRTCLATRAATPAGTHALQALLLLPRQHSVMRTHPLHCHDRGGVFHSARRSASSQLAQTCVQAKAAGLAFGHTFQ